MKNKIKVLKLFAYIFVLVELIGAAIFAVFYFADLYDFKTLVAPEDITLGALILIGFNIIILWLSIVSITGSRYRTDLKAAVTFELLPLHLSFVQFVPLFQVR